MPDAAGLPGSSSSADNARRMDAMYRFQRHIYDLTRKFFLLGRDDLIGSLDLKPDDVLVEVGCGTGRNLIRVAERYRRTHLAGVDVSSEMLVTAASSVRKAGLSDRISLQLADATNFRFDALPGTGARVNHAACSYALSIMPDPVWRQAADNIIDQLPPGGVLHVVDFGDQAGLPKWFRSVLFSWLKLFHVYWRPEVIDHFRNLEASGRGKLEFVPLYRGYCYRLRFTKAAG